MRTSPRTPAPRGARPATGPAGERVLEGLPVSPGIAIGTVLLVDNALKATPEYAVPETGVAAEIARFDDAIARATRQLAKLKLKTAGLPTGTAEELGYLLDAHEAMLSSDRLTCGVRRRIAEGRINAEAAVRAEIGAICDGFAGMGDPYLAARAQDIREVGDRLVRHLTGSPYHAFKHLPPHTIVVAEELSPADTALMDPASVVGFATVLGGAEGHTAIMARSLGFPAVIGVAGLTQAVKTGDKVVVDGEAGQVLLAPSEATLEEYRRRRSAIQRLRRQLGRLKTLPAVTRDGVRIGLQANLELPRELDSAIDAGAEGIGLLRTEFLFMNRSDLPSEEEQYAALAHLVEGMGGRPVTVRTLDLGGDKLAPALGDRYLGPNPALGVRAIRLSLREPELLETQLAAILRAGAHGPVRVLLPMISSASQVVQVRAVLERVARRLRTRRVRIARPLPPLGAMIEIPGAALAADALARACDFFAIGTNDLTMYALAIDRGDEQVASLYDPLHPAVLRLVQFAVQAALRAGVPVSICGEIAGNPRFAPLLLGLGVRELSMAATNVARVKQRIRALDLVTATRRAAAVMDETDEARIAALVDEFNAAL